MTTLAFDTLKFAQTLRDKAKFTQEQSEGLANAIADATSDQIATKGDLTRVEGDLRTYIQSVDASVQRLEISLKSELKTVESRLETKIELLRSDVLKWIVGSIGFQTLVILGAVITLTRVIGHP
jgi:CO dehydrogenase/acetyl-CoA synthase beta subunit